MNIKEKLELILSFTGKIATAHKMEADRLLQKLETTGDMDLIEEMSVDSIIEIWSIPKVK